MALYQVLETSYVGDRLYIIHPGDTTPVFCNYDPPVGKDEDGKPSPTKVGPNLKLVTGPTVAQAKADIAKAEAELAAAQASAIGATLG